MDARAITLVGGVDRLSAYVQPPQGSQDEKRACEIVDNADGTYTVQFNAYETGKARFILCYGKSHNINKNKF